MPLPSLDVPIDQVDDLNTSLGAITAAIAALPATPREVDLPDIVKIVADLTAAAGSLQTIVAQVLIVLSTTRVNQ